jgi:hypothetical protein
MAICIIQKGVIHESEALRESILTGMTVKKIAQQVKSGYKDRGKIKLNDICL